MKYYITYGGRFRERDGAVVCLSIRGGTQKTVGTSYPNRYRNNLKIIRFLVRRFCKEYGYDGEVKIWNEI